MQGYTHPSTVSPAAIGGKVLNGNRLLKSKPQRDIPPGQSRTGRKTRKVPRRKTVFCGPETACQVGTNFDNKSVAVPRRAQRRQVFRPSRSCHLEVA